MEPSEEDVEDARKTVAHTLCGYNPGVDNFPMSVLVNTDLLIRVLAVKNMHIRRGTYPVTLVRRTSGN
jgi:hypothetical protein